MEERYVYIYRLDGKQFCCIRRKVQFFIFSVCFRLMTGHIYIFNISSETADGLSCGCNSESHLRMKLGKYHRDSTSSAKHLRILDTIQVSIHFKDEFFRKILSHIMYSKNVAKFVTNSVLLQKSCKNSDFSLSNNNSLR